MRKLKPPTFKAPDLKAPEFARDLVRDLRERRLLPLIAVIGLAILVVPFALSEPSSSSDPAAAAGPGAGGGASEASQLTVVASETGLRDYRRRLAGAPKDPFAQQFAAPEGGPGSEQPGGGEVPPGAGEVPGGSGGEVPPLGGTDLPPADGDEEPTLPADEEPEPAYVVSVKAGPPDEMKEQKLSEPTILPGEDNPLLIFNGPDGKGGKAIFRVTSEVNAVYGDAECLKGTDRCERLAVQVGDTITVLYGEEGDERSYRLTVVDIELNRRPGSGSGR
jgi:hypothetical protein